ncbi:MAG: Ig-like domain-containing protein, partial [Candidatus Nitrotoga sp.]
TLLVSDNGNTGTGGTLTATDTATINLTAVNDAPLAAITPLTYTATEQVALTLKNTGLSISDVDAAAGSMTVTLSVTEGTLNVTAGTSGAIVSNSGTSGVTITGTVTQINSLLGADLTSTVSYTNNSDTPAASATLTLLVSDNGNTGTGGTLTATDTATINLTAVNDAPVLGGTVGASYTESTPAIALITGATVLDVDATNFNFGTLTAAFATYQVGDVLSINNEGAAAGQIGIGVANVVTYGGTDIGIFSGVTASSLIVTLNASADATAVAALMGQLRYSSTSINPTNSGAAATRALTVTLNDGGNTGAGVQTGSVSGTVSITAVNTPPVLSANTLTVNEGATVVLNASNFAATDLDSNVLTFTVSGVSGGQFEFVAAPGVAITSFTNAQIAGGTVRFVHDGGEAAPVFSTEVSDGAAATTAVAATVTFTNVNDAPILVNNTLQVLVPVNGTIIPITSANFSATDPDAVGALTFTVSGVTGGTFQVNVADATSFTPAQIAASQVTFVVAGTLPPTFSTSVSDGIVSTAAAPATSNGPLLVSSTPVDNSNSFAEGGAIVLTFNKAVQMGSGNIVINGGTDVRIIPVTDISQVTFSGSTVTINPPLDLLSDHTYFVTIESGAIKDTIGPTPNVFSGILDTTTLNFLTGPAPTLVGSSPADNATAVVLGNNIVLTFSENVVAGVGDIVITNANNANAGDTRTISVTNPQVTFIGNTVTINPTADLLTNGVYNVQMASGVIKDAAGNPYAGILDAATLNFNTTSTIAPTLLVSSPADGGLDVAVSSNIVLTFSDAVIAGTGNITISNGAGDARTIGVTDTNQVTFSGNTVTINPTLNLIGGTGYNVQIANTAIKSTSNIAFAGILNATTLNFTITTDLPPIVTDANINITLTGTGVLAGETAGQVYIVDDMITATWNNSAGGDNNVDVTSVVMDFSEFNSGAPALVSATLNAGIWTATYTVTNITANSLNNRNVAVIATDTVGNATTTRDGTNLSVQDTTAPTVTINTIMGDNQLNNFEATRLNTGVVNFANPGNEPNALSWFISGTTDAPVGSIITIVIEDGVHPAIGGEAEVLADGTWKVVADSLNDPASNTLFDIQFLEPGQMTVIASVADAAGNIGESSPAIFIMDIETPSVLGSSFTTGANASVTLNFTEVMGTPTTAGLTILKNGTEAVTPGILFGGTTTNLTIATTALLATTDFVKVQYVDAAGNWGDAAGNQVADSQWFIGGGGSNTINVHAINGSITVPVAATIFGNAGNDIITGSNTTATGGANPYGDVI